MNMMLGGTRLAVVNGSVGNVIPALAGKESRVASIDNAATLSLWCNECRRRRNGCLRLFMAKALLLNVISLQKHLGTPGSLADSGNAIPRR
ncbi:hypothetical protein XGA_2225 [Xanthomonas hortorum ATCC 19865]|nr:hypothetical protein XGA_2225 [Xanthomonas hortorum ATCC 19865]